MVPQAAPVQPLPATVHVSAPFSLLLTKAEKLTVLLSNTVALRGVIDTLTARPGNSATVAVPCFELSALDVAVTVTVDGFGTLPGALYTPRDDMAPQSEPVQPVPATDHVTAVFVVPVT